MPADEPFSETATEVLVEQLAPPPAATDHPAREPHGVAGILLLLDAHH